MVNSLTNASYWNITSSVTYDKNLIQASRTSLKKKQRGPLTKNRGKTNDVDVNLSVKSKTRGMLQYRALKFTVKAAGMTPVLYV